MFQHDLLHFHLLPFIAFSFSPFTTIYYIFCYIFITSCNWGAFITIYSIYYKRYLHLFHLFHLWEMVLCINTIYSIYYRLGGNLVMNVYIWKLQAWGQRGHECLYLKIDDLLHIVERSWNHNFMIYISWYQIWY